MVRTVHDATLEGKRVRWQRVAVVVDGGEVFNMGQVYEDTVAKPAAAARMATHWPLPLHCRKAE
jgi:osmotically-inducible protein OsmY